MIKSFKDKNTEALFSGKFVKEFSGFQRQAIRRLQILDCAPSLNDLRALPSNRFEALKGNRKGEYSISINMQWRVYFKWYQDTEILHEKRRITSDTALRMNRFFGTTAEFWMNLQQAYDLKITREEKWREIEMSVRPLCVNA